MRKKERVYIIKDVSRIPIRKLIFIDEVGDGFFLKWNIFLRNIY
jgi:hypothetical protein